MALCEGQVGTAAGILERISMASSSEVEKGRKFEEIVKVYLENDPIQKQNIERVWCFADWARENGHVGVDKGTDLIALRTDGELAGVQCKFRTENGNVTKSEIQSFALDAVRLGINNLILADTVSGNINKSADEALFAVDKNYCRITLELLEESAIDWEEYEQIGKVRLRYEPKILRDDQKEAVRNVIEGLKSSDRGKMIMACGTGKTLTALRIAESITKRSGLVLYMVPSLALMSQAVRDWKLDCDYDFLAFSVCSDKNVGMEPDSINRSFRELALPATTDAEEISHAFNKKIESNKMTVFFSTYQSIQTIEIAQKNHGLPHFDLIICDEAHRTTGIIKSGKDKTNFVKIHKNEHIQGKKRLYMTATPKIFGKKARSVANKHDIELASMDNEEDYGKVLHYHGFAKAVEQKLLTDYKVIILAMNENTVSKSMQKRLLNEDKAELKLDEETKIVGCYKALLKEGVFGETDSESPVKTALSFCNTIKKSKWFSQNFCKVVEGFHDFIGADQKLSVEARHIDGSSNARDRNLALNWLRYNDKSGGGGGSPNSLEC